MAAGTIATLSLTVLVAARWVRAHRGLRRARRNHGTLSACHGDTETLGEGLSPRLLALVHDARVLRMIAVTPLNRVEVPLLDASPARRRERCEAYDRAVVELRRAIWEWRNSFSALSGQEIRLLAASGVRGVPLRSVLLGGLDRTRKTWEGVWVRRPSVQRAASVLARVDAELRSFERAVLAVGQDPYRAMA